MSEHHRPLTAREQIALQYYAIPMKPAKESTLQACFSFADNFLAQSRGPSDADRTNQELTRINKKLHRQIDAGRSGLIAVRELLNEQEVSNGADHTAAICLINNALDASAYQLDY